jgi:hypothetical protein
VHGYQVHGVGAKEQQNQAHSEHSMNELKQFVLGIKNTRTKDTRLDPRCVSSICSLPMVTAAPLGQIRRIDESGKDDLYPEQLFRPSAVTPVRRGSCGRATDARA